MPSDIIYSATEWPTNAALIGDVHKLGWLRDDDLILDPTYGKGSWWRVWHPTTGQVIGHQWKQEVPRTLSVVWGDWLRHTQPWDFKDMWYRDELFDAVAFDPPYVSVGGRDTTTIHKMHDAYGMDGTPLSPAGVQADINQGLMECARVVKKGGIVLVKCQSYVTSGKLFPGLFLTWLNAELEGLKLVDHLNYVGGSRPQPDGRQQKHSRRNQSDLLIFRRPKR
jgi:hypothetical protein